MPSKPLVVRASILILALLPRVDGAQSAPQPPASPPATHGGLPPIGCVEAVRDARLARDRSDTPAARRKLEAAVELPGCELPALSGLLRILRESFRLTGSADGVATVRDRLAARLSDPSTELPDGFLTQLERIDAASADREGDQALLSAVQKRDAGASTTHVELSLSERVEILEVMANLEERLGQVEAAREALGRLLVLAPSDAVRWQALMSDLAGSAGPVQPTCWQPWCKPRSARGFACFRHHAGAPRAPTNAPPARKRDASAAGSVSAGPSRNIPARRKVKTPCVAFKAGPEPSASSPCLGSAGPCATPVVMPKPPACSVCHLRPQQQEAQSALLHLTARPGARRRRQP